MKLDVCDLSIVTSEQQTDCPTDAYMSSRDPPRVFRHLAWCRAAAQTCKEDYCINYSPLCTSPLPPCTQRDHETPTISHATTCNTDCTTDPFSSFPCSCFMSVPH